MYTMSTWLDTTLCVCLCCPFTHRIEWMIYVTHMNESCLCILPIRICHIKKWPSHVTHWSFVFVQVAQPVSADPPACLTAGNKRSDMSSTCIYMHTYVCTVYIYINVYVHIYTCMLSWIIYMYIYVCVCIYIILRDGDTCTHANALVHTPARPHKHTQHTHTHTHTHTRMNHRS